MMSQKGVRVCGGWVGSILMKNAAMFEICPPFPGDNSAEETYEKR